MTLEDRTPQGGTAVVTAGNLAVAASVVATLAAGPRVLGHDAFAGLALGWTAITIFGFGVAMPSEQLIIRRRSADLGSDLRHLTWRLVAVAALACVLALLWASGSAADDSFPLLGAAVVAGIAGWTVAALARGRMAGAGMLSRYALIYVVEALVRGSLVLVALLTPADLAVAIMAAALGVPVLVAGLVAASTMAAAPRTGAPPPQASQQVARAEPRHEQLAFVLVALGYQACLNAAPFVVERRWPGSPDMVGAFVVASSYYRFATLLASGFTTPALVRLSRAWARGDQRDFTHGARRATVGAALASGLATAAAWFASPLALRLFYGENPGLPEVVVLGLAVSTVGATAAAVAGTALMASHRAMRAAGLWLAGAAVVVILVAMDSTMGGLTALGLVLGPSVVLSGALVALRRRGSKDPDVSDDA